MELEFVIWTNRTEDIVEHMEEHSHGLLPPVRVALEQCNEIVHIYIGLRKRPAQPWRVNTFCGRCVSWGVELNRRPKSVSFQSMRDFLVELLETLIHQVGACFHCG